MPQCPIPRCWNPQPCKRHPQRGRSESADAIKRDVHWSPRWRAVRSEFLRAHPLCADCHAAGRLVPARDVDHVVPISEGGEPWDHANLQALCHRCHSRKTRREQLERTRTPA